MYMIGMQVLSRDPVVSATQKPTFHLVHTMLHRIAD